MTSTGRGAPRVIAHAPALGDQGSRARTFDRSNPDGASDRADAGLATLPALGDQGSRARTWSRAHVDDAERERLAATLGALLRSMRAERHLSTRALAVRSTVARSTITRLEAGERRPRPALFAALAYGLDHTNPAPIAEALTEAAGPSLRPDTPQAVRRRTRRLGRAQRRIHALRLEVGREAGRSRVRAQEFTISGLRAIPTPPPGALTSRQLDQWATAIKRAEAIQAQARRLDYRADHLMRTLAWPYHPLDGEPLERALER